MKGLMATIIEVAAAAGVSTATVWRVLSQPDCVSEKTRRHVAEVIDRLGYRPNAAAGALRTLRVAKLLVTVPDISNPFFASVIRGAEEAARDASYTIVLGDTGMTRCSRINMPTCSVATKSMGWFSGPPAAGIAAGHG